MSSTFEPQVVSPYPLDPLSRQEIEILAAVIRSRADFSPRLRFISATLREPPLDVLRGYRNGDRVAREAEVILTDQGKTYEALVDLVGQRLLQFQHIPGVQAPIPFEEALECEVAVKAYGPFQEAMRRRGITDMELVWIDSWPAGYYSENDAPSMRLSRPLVFVCMDSEDNGYAHPVEGLSILVDLTNMEVVQCIDHGIVPIPQEQAPYAAGKAGPLRQDLKPLSITQPEGVSFQVDGYHVHWQNWDFHLGFTHREGLVLHQVCYEDQGRLRPVMSRMSVAEMIVPYGDPSPLHYTRNVLDEGEHGLGCQANSLELGCDCLGVIRYFDAYLIDCAGNVVPKPNVICMHEEDFGVIWKHTEFRSERSHVRRSRRLVISFFATVGVYDYGFYYYLYQDGSIEAEVKLTGIMSTRAMMPDEPAKPRNGTLVAPGVNAMIHQHFFCFRMVMEVDGPQNSVYEVHVEAEPAGERNPFGNAFFARETLLRTEQEAQQVVDPLAGRYWKVVNSHMRNRMGEPVGYKLMPGETAVAFARPEAAWLKRAAFSTRNLWVTPYADDERYPAGDYPNQHAGGAGITTWTAANRSVEDVQLVLWYIMGVTHVPRIEDYPVMPVKRVGFWLLPTGFFDRNPALDVPLPPGHDTGVCEHE